MFQSGSTNGRHYQIHFDTSKPLVYNYAVDASWLPPNPDPPIAVPGDFPPSANMPEPYRISVSITENDLFFVDNTNKGGHAHVKADVYDWGGCKYDTLKADTTFGLTIDVTDPPTGTGDELSTYEFDLDGNDLSSSGNVTALISATANDATYGLGTISAKNVATYVFLTIPVSGIATPPTVTGIDPNHYEIKKTLVGAVVTGTSFASNAHVSLIKDGATNPVIDAVNEVVAGGNSITCDIPLTDPGVLPGKYDVRVTNPGTGLYGELDKGFTVDDVNAPWPGWMAGGLNEAASKFVGYGSTGAPTAPKWVYSNTSYGGPAAGCAIGKDGTIYLCTSGQGTGPYVALHAVNPDGSLKWIFSKSGACWISFCPAIDKDGYIYVCEGTPSVNYLYKVDPASHTEVWSCNLGSTACYTTAPAIGLDGAVYVAYCGAQPGYIRRVEPDGTLGWGYWIPSAFSPSLSWQLGMAVLPGGDIVAAAGTHGRIIRFHPDGSTVWLYQYSWWTLETPSVGPEGNVYFTTYDGGGLVELDSGGNFQWEYPTGYFLWASPVVDPVTGHIFFGDRLGKFRCFDNAKNMLWTHDFGATHIDGTAAVDANGDVYCAVGNQPSQPYIGLVKMSGTDGSIIWQSDMFDDMITTAPAIGPDGTVYLPGYDNQHLLLAYGN
jgi:hypothetical protein